MIDLDKRLEAKQKLSKREKGKKRAKRREKRRKTEGGVDIKQEDEGVGVLRKLHFTLATIIRAEAYDCR